MLTDGGLLVNISLLRTKSQLRGRWPGDSSREDLEASHVGDIWGHVFNCFWGTAAVFPALQWELKHETCVLWSNKKRVFCVCFFLCVCVFSWQSGLSHGTISSLFIVCIRKSFTSDRGRPSRDQAWWCGARTRGSRLVWNGPSVEEHNFFLSIFRKASSYQKHPNASGSIFWKKQDHTISLSGVPCWISWGVLVFL